MKYLIIAAIMLLSPSLYASVEFVWGMREQLGEYETIANVFKKDIESTSKGEIKITIKKFSDDPKNPVKEIEDGHLQIYQVPTGLLRSIANSPENDWLDAWDMPFLFKNKDHVEKYILSKHAQEKINSLNSEKILALTYSYAGGFLGVVSQRDHKSIDLEKLSFCNLTEFEGKPMKAADEKQFMSELPCKSLLYDLDIVTRFKDNFKRNLKIDFNNHKVFSRITLMSQKHFDKIPAKYKELFISKLNLLLNEERQSIYAQAENNLKLLQQDKHLELHVINEKTRGVASEEHIKKNTHSKILTTEIEFIKGLEK